MDPAFCYIISLDEVFFESGREGERAKVEGREEKADTMLADTTLPCLEGSLMYLPKYTVISICSLIINIC